jgi:hypothetical protein
MTGQMRDFDPRQYKKTGIIGQPLQIAFARVGLPAKKSIAVCALPCSRTEEGTGYRTLVPIPKHVTKILAHGITVTKVVVLRE